MVQRGGGGEALRAAFLTSNQAVAEGAMAAGLGVYVGYPITPSSDMFEYLSEELPKRGGVVFQAEDEIASINALVGASLAGAKAMTATSGPGFSLMMEGIGFAAMVEAPLLVVDVMRAGPSTGIATQVGQGDIFQARWGSHGVYNLVAYAPASAQEAYDYAVRSFNAAYMVRTPVILMTDGALAHTRERVMLRDPGELEVVGRKRPNVPPDQYRPYRPDPEDLVPPMAFYGEGYHPIAESLTHDERGYYKTDDEIHRALVERLVRKVEVNKRRLVASRSYYTEDAEVLFVAIGSVARNLLALVRELRASGVRAGLFRPISLWPFDDESFVAAAARARSIVTVELNQGQIYAMLKGVLWDNRDKVANPTLYNLEMPYPSLPSPDDIMEEIRSRGWRLW
ncbi:MAG: 2-oxoacid:acceptor oxidoreductase subunit alpha [Nitrososphaeria archaeon]